MRVFAAFGPGRWIQYLALLVLADTAFAAITVDGVLDEPEWRDAQVFGEFVETEPRTGEPARYRTVARLYTDESGIYVSFTNYQPPGVQRITRRFARDLDIAADRNIIGLDFDGNRLTGYDFTVGASNSQQDGIFNGEVNYSKDWDGTWYSQTSADEDAWYSEVHIPWTVAPMARADNGVKTMRIYLGRFVFAESLRFAFPDAAFERTTFLSDWYPVQVEQVRTSTLDFFPYLTYSHETVESESTWKAGLDVVWRPNNGTQLTAAINPDFGQVEADDLVVNFSPIEVFFSEKRPFFTENQSLFNRDIPNGDLLVNTRRIGAESDAGDELFTDIDLALKMTGFGNALDYGVFAVQEDDTSLSDGGTYASTRIQGHLERLDLGHSLTWADRPTLDRRAMVNSFDADWRASDKVRVLGQFMLSDIEQDANEFNDFLEQEESDVGGYGRLRWAPSEEWQHTFTGYYYGDEFDINDLGFLQRNDLLLLEGVHRFEVLDYGPESPQRTSVSTFEYTYEENTDGDKLLPFMVFGHEVIFDSTRVLAGTAAFQSAGSDDLISRGGGLVHIPQQQFYNLSYTSRRNTPFGYSVRFLLENDGTEEFSRELAFTPTWFVAPTVTLSGEVSYRQYDEWLLYDFPSEQMATFEAEQYGLDFRLDWYPSTRQEVRLKFQWVAVSAEALGGFDLSDSGRLIPSGVPVSDFSVSDTAVQLRYRYELAPLSDIFLVYSRGGLFNEDAYEDSAVELLQNGWDEKFVETILAKIRYRF